MGGQAAARHRHAHPGAEDQVFERHPGGHHHLGHAAAHRPARARLGLGVLGAGAAAGAARARAQVVSARAGPQRPLHGRHVLLLARGAPVELYVRVAPLRLLDDRLRPPARRVLPDVLVQVRVAAGARRRPADAAPPARGRQDLCRRQHHALVLPNRARLPMLPKGSCGAQSREWRMERPGDAAAAQALQRGCRQQPLDADRLRRRQARTRGLAAHGIHRAARAARRSPSGDGAVQKGSARSRASTAHQRQRTRRNGGHMSHRIRRSRSRAYSSTRFDPRRCRCRCSEHTGSGREGCKRRAEPCPARAQAGRRAATTQRVAAARRHASRLEATGREPKSERGTCGCLRLPQRRRLGRCKSSAD
mmetsp:Transcript_16973/g.36386  ORF Transcript_16973/g.36386 Transcript_16973/m.36386 type:complete len:363 (-) Transcript_16973:334-1422(-)